MTTEPLLQQLSSFAPEQRQAALAQLAPQASPAAVGEDVNMHFHSFFSYNAEGWSPSRIAWEARQAGLYAAGLCDFDVLDGLDEFLCAAEALGLRATVNLETRAFLREYADKEISSPGEPGVTYIMGGGFPRIPDTGTPAAIGLQGYRDSATARNVAVIERVNPHVPDIAVDYAADVLPLTPLGGATERHIIRAYVNRAEAAFGAPAAVAAYWAELTGKEPAQIEALLGTPALEELVRSKLVKKGGFGYVQPSEDTFPPVDEFVQWVLAAGGIPMITWLDGTSAGEADAEAMVECLVAKGCAALNIIPDRNWNLKDPAEQATKVANLREMVRVADARGLPINIGTEMNKVGLPFVDDLAGPVLSEFRESFLRGARIMVGHSILARYAARPYTTCPREPRDRDSFFEAVGALPPLTTPVAAALQDAGPDAAFAAIKDAVTRGAW